MSQDATLGFFIESPLDNAVKNVDGISILDTGFQFSGSDSSTGVQKFIKVLGPSEISFRNYEITWPSDVPVVGEALKVSASSYDSTADLQTVSLRWGTDVGLFTEDSAGAVDTDHNIYGGTNAGGSIVTGVENFFAGVDAGAANTTGNSNIAVGNTALASSTIQSDNVAIGVGTLTTSNGGSQNVGIGSGALAALTTTDDNVAVGYDAASVGTLMAQSIYIGSGTRSSGTANEIVIGYGATGKGNNTVLLGNGSTTDVYIGQTSATSPPNLVLFGDDTLGTDHTLKIRLPSNAGLNADRSWTLPAAAPTAGNALKVNTGGAAAILEWGPGGAFVESGTNSIYSYGGGNGGTGNFNFSAIDGALNSATLSGDNNIGIGNGAGGSITTGANNIALGASSDCLATGSNQIAIGQGVVTTTANTAIIGNSSITDVYISAGSGGTPTNLVLFGDDSLGTDHTLKIRLPSDVGLNADRTWTLPAAAPTAGNALVVNTGGASAILEWGPGGAFVESGTNSIYSYGGGNGGTGNFNFSAIDGALNSATLSGDNNIGIGNGAGGSITTGAGNIALGASSDCLATGNNQIAIGQGVVTTTANTAIIGNSSITDVYISAGSGGTPTNLVLIGDDTVTDRTLKIRLPSNAALVDQSWTLPAAAPVAGNSLVVNTGGTAAILEWGAGGAFVESGTNSIYSYGGGNGGTGNYNFAAIDGALNGATLTGDYNVGIGNDALLATTSGSNNVGIGYRSLYQVATGSSNVGIGYLSGSVSDLTGAVCVGQSALGANYCVSVGYASDTSGQYGIAIGNAADSNRDYTICIGYSSTSSVTVSTVPAGIAIGSFAYTGLGAIALGCATNTLYRTYAAGQSSIAIGCGGTATSLGAQATNTGAVAVGGSVSASAGATASGLYSVAIGAEAKASGDGCIAIGYTASASIGNSICIGYTGGATKSGVVAIGQTVAAHQDGVVIGNASLTSGAGTGSIVLGSNSQSGSYAISIGNTCVATGLAGICIGYNSTATAAGSVVLGTAINDGPGVTGFYVTHVTAAANNAANFNGNHLYEVVSSRRFKTNITTVVDENDSNFDSLNPVTFTSLCEHDDPDKKFMGLIAEEVEELYPIFVNHEEDGVTASGIQYENMVSLLIEKVKRLRKQNRDQQSQIDNIMQRLTALEN
uniref:Peptidase S74 domain-containing protein n=1 Tax=viral metagenome TaxID=1070528 RepID=A0A6C0EKT9_9ZZZZ